MSSFKTLDDLGDITGKNAQVRVDLNLPMKDGSATDVSRVEAVKPTILELADKGAKVLLLAHYGRPKGKRYSTMSTSFVQGDVEKVLDKEIMFIPEVMGPVVEQSIGILANGDIGLLDNVRFWPGEEANDPEFARGMAAHGASPSVLACARRTARMPAPRGWRTIFRPMRAARWKPN